MIRPATATNFSTYAIIGNGIAGITAAEIVREEDAQADITVIADDPYPVYYRPALKDYLAGRVHEDKLWARPTNFYQDRAICFLRERVVGIQVEAHTLELQSGQRFHYQQLLLAQGARASNLSCPGVNLKGVLTLRTIADYQEVENCLARTEHIVVTGSGTLALETIETLRHRGYRVTHLLRKQVLWSEILDATASDLVLQQERRDGVEVRQGEEIAEIYGQNGRVSGVVTTSGTQLPCELVIIAIGIDPIIDFVQRSGIACGRGVQVDASMRTTAPDIYAAGDILETTNPLTGRTRVLGQWYPAIQQARAAAYAMLGLLDTTRPFLAGTFYNASFLYGLDFASVGVTALPQNSRGYQEVVADPRPRCYQKVILKGGVPVGALGLGNRNGILAYKRAIDHRVDLSPVIGRLFAPTFQLDAWLDQQGVPAPILSVHREGALAARQREGDGTKDRKVAREAQQLLSEVPAMATGFLDLSEIKKMISSQQPLLTPQGELHLPEATQPLPAAVVATLQNSPALVLIREGQPKVFYLRVPGSTNRRDDQRLRIGRDRENEIVLTDISVSRRHAELVPSPNGFYLHDLKSSNGVLVNQIKITNPYQLAHGDRISIGSSVSYFFWLHSSIPSRSDAVQASSYTCQTCGTKPENRAASFCPVCGAPFMTTPQEARRRVNLSHNRW